MTSIVVGYLHPRKAVSWSEVNVCARKIYIDGRISSDRSLLRDTSGVAASAFSVFIPARFFQ